MRHSGESNFGKIGSPEIDAKIEQTLDELDPAKARDLANEVDKLIWAEGFSLPLTQSPETSRCEALWRTSAPSVLPIADYTKIGFMKP